MSRQAEAPLKKITINIFHSDYIYLTMRYGTGYQELVRKFIEEKVKELKDHGG